MIGLFDSGFGGLSVLNQFHEKLPNYSFIYYGDSLNAPYGDKSKEEIYELTKSSVDFLFNQGAVLVLVVCNTISVGVLRKLQNDYFSKKYKTKKVLGIVVPNIEHITSVSKQNFNLGIIGTKHTIDSNKYSKEIIKKRKDINISTKACPKFAENIEKNKFQSLEFLANIKEEMRFFKNKQLDYLLLACTHYSFIKKEIKVFLSPGTKVLDSSDVVVERTITYLAKHVDLDIKKEALTLIYTSGDLIFFKQISEKLLINTPNRSLKFLKTPIFTQD